MSFASIRKRLQSPSWLTRWRDPAHRLGLRGERVAARFLKRRRYRVLVRNYRCAAGEIDLICRHADTIVFVEVKTRSGDSAQDTQETVSAAQWRRVENAARCYLVKTASQHRPCRFDFVTILWPPNKTPRVEHFPDAYQARRG